MQKECASAARCGKFKITLDGAGSRTLVIPENITLDDFHCVIQAVFGWDNEHGWRFRDSLGRRYEWKSDSGMESFRVGRIISPDKVCLSDVLPERGGKLRYVYDYGDNWRHVIVRMTDPKEPGCYCVKTEGPDGIEDAGGVWGLFDCKSEWHVPCAEEITDRLQNLELTPQESASGLLAREAREIESRIARIDEYEWECLCKLGDEGYADVLRWGEDFAWLLAHFPGITFPRISFSDTRNYDASPEFRRYWRKRREAWERLRVESGAAGKISPDFDLPEETLQDIDDFVRAAANLYGAVGVDDLCELFGYWKGNAPWLENATRQTAEYAIMRLRKRGVVGDTPVFFRDGYAVSFIRYSLALELDESTLSRMLELRKGKERIYPGSYAEFMEHEHENVYLTEEYSDLEDFIFGTWNLGEENRERVQRVLSDVHDLFATGLDWRQASAYIVDNLDLQELDEDAFDRFARILARVCNVTPSDLNWGYAPYEMVEMYGKDGADAARLASFGYVPESIEPIVRETPKVGRNDPCPCGSGKKYKKCCGRADN